MKTRNKILGCLWLLSFASFVISYYLECQMLNYESQGVFNSLGYWLLYNCWIAWVITGALIFISILGAVSCIILGSIETKLKQLKVTCPYCISWDRAEDLWQKNEEKGRKNEGKP